MSDIYLELRSRIPVVAARTAVGTARIQAAQDAVGLSNEAVARLIPVSEKTWRRWKEAGEIPTAALPAVARALRLELIGVVPEPFDVGPTNGGVSQPSNAEVVQRIEQLEVAVESLRQAVLASLPQSGTGPS